MPHNTIRPRPTIGVLMTMPVYDGTIIMPYQRTVLQGIYASAIAYDCNLLLACGMDAIPSPHAKLPAWPTLANTTTFVPVGPWNTDGLIVVGMYLSTEQEHYLRGLADDGHPLVYAGFEGPGPSVNLDNASGIHQALAHLRAHGHQRIAFISGFDPPVGESRPRLEAYLDLTRTMQLDTDPRLIAPGDLNIEGGRRAMRQILASGVPFTAVLAACDKSCIGAAEVLKEHGLHIPDDVAMIGFDDLLDAQAHVPPLTTVYNPAFAVGQQALRTLLDMITGRPSESSSIQLPVRLVVRRSCGCRPGVEHVGATSHWQPAADSLSALARAMAEAVLLEARTGPDEVTSICHALIESFIASIQSADGAAFEDALLNVLRRVEALDDDAYAWHLVLSTLRHGLADLHPALPLSTRAFAEELLHRGDQMVSERTRRQAARAVLREENLADRLGQITAQLLATLDLSRIPPILAEHLPQLNVPHLLGALFVPDQDDPVAESEPILSYGLAGATDRQCFITRQFPPPHLYPPHRSFQLALLPLVTQEVGRGFVVFDAANLEPCGAIVRNLAAALRGSHLYGEALLGRQQAEEANRLKSRFLSMVSHELRTPLNLIVGLSELLLHQQSPMPAVSNTTSGDLERIYTSAQHLGQLIGDVLDLASSEAGQLHLLREPLDLAEVLRVVATTGEHMAREKGLDWKARLPPAGPWVLGDRTRLRQVVLNLISNAVKFTTSGMVSLELIVEESAVTVEVSDTGLGVPAAEQTRIFEEFQRTERTTARGYGGLGLGLAICKQLVELHGGTISVRSAGEEGSGATFLFTLPTMVVDRWLMSPPAEPEMAHEQPVVILTRRAADGPSLNAYLTERGLAARVFHVDVETDWLPELLAAPPGAILLDAQLVVQQGWQILDTLQRHPATRHLPLVVCTLDPQGQHGVLLDLNYQRKPLDATQLARILMYQGLLADDEVAAKTILIVDDDPGIRDLHARLLQQQSARYRVLQARDGREALVVMQQTRPDLVLLDLLMPELDGFGVLNAMRAMEMTREVPVVVLTAQTLTEAEMERLNHGVTAILSKGLFSGDEILAHVESALARRRKLGGATQQLMRKALAYIHEHYAEPLTRAQIAQYVGIAETYLSDCFHEELGVPPMTYLIRYRIKQARALLEAGARSVTDVALVVGFVDNAHFSRVFQREVGVSPNAYRRGKRAPA